MNAPHKSAPVSELPDISARPSFFGTGVVYPALGKTEEERKAALVRFLALANQIAQSVDPIDDVKMTRDEMHER
jgi:hypothetical protein